MSGLQLSRSVKCIWRKYNLYFYLLDELANRPRLNLKPRSTGKPVANEMADSAQRSLIFGDGKPREERNT